MSVLSSTTSTCLNISLACPFLVSFLSIPHTLPLCMASHIHTLSTNTLTSSFPRYHYLILDTFRIFLVNTLLAIVSPYKNFIISRVVPSHPPPLRVIYNEGMLNFLKSSVLQLSRWRWDFCLYVCLLVVLYLLIYTCWLILASPGWKQLDHGIQLSSSDRDFDLQLFYCVYLCPGSSGKLVCSFFLCPDPVLITRWHLLVVKPSFLFHVAV